MTVLLEYDSMTDTHVRHMHGAMTGCNWAMKYTCKNYYYVVTITIGGVRYMFHIPSHNYNALKIRLTLTVIIHHLVHHPSCVASPVASRQTRPVVRLDLVMGDY